MLANGRRMTDVALHLVNVERRRRQAEKAMRRQISYREALPTQRPNGLTPISSPWFTDRRGWRCRLLSADPVDVENYIAEMGEWVLPPGEVVSSIGQKLLPFAPDAPMLPSGEQEERSCDKVRATGGSNSGTPLD